GGDQPGLRGSGAHGLPPRGAALCASLSSRWPQASSLRPAQGNLHGTDMTLITANPFGPRSNESVVAPGGFEPLAQPRGCASSRGDPARGSASPVQGS